MSDGQGQVRRSPAVVELRTFVVAGQPLAVASAHDGQIGDGMAAPDDSGESSLWWRQLAASGLPTIDGLLGADLPRGARVGFSLEAAVLRLVDESDTTLLRASREGLDEAWLKVVRRRKGTMFLVVRDVDLSAQHTAADLLPRIDEAARQRPALGAIVGVVEERPQLPLMFG